jgi:hypothetical protein
MTVCSDIQGIGIVFQVPQNNVNPIENGLRALIGDTDKSYDQYYNLCIMHDFLALKYKKLIYKKKSIRN